MFDFLLRCHLPEQTLIDYRAGLLDKRSFEMLEEHLLLCPTCQLQLEELAYKAAGPGLLHACQGCEMHGFVVFAGSGWRP
jgi:hypothetical protein